METPDNVNPLYPLSGCLHSEDDISKCHECKEEITIDTESDNPCLCRDCFNIENNPLDDFVENVIRFMYQNPDWESMLIIKQC